MSALVYPANLPGPISMPQQRAERRALTGLPGPRQSRALWRDRLDPSVPVTFRFRTLDQAEQFNDWLHGEQIDGGAWFAATWRVPQGGGGVFRFVEAPSFPQWLAPNVWECRGVLEIRGRSLPPVGAYRNCIDEDIGTTSLDEYETLSGNRSLFSVGSSPYGGVMRLASQNSDTEAEIARSFSPIIGVTLIEVTFRVTTAHDDDAGAIHLYGGGLLQFALNPRRQSDLRPLVVYDTEELEIGSGPLVVGEYYRLSVTVTPGVVGTLAKVTKLSDSSTIVQPFLGHLRAVDVDAIHFFIDKSGQTTADEFGNIHVCALTP
jgi:hypothetical protein